MIIGLLANAGAGKDTAADYLVKHHGFVKIAFADPIKVACKDFFDFTDEQLWGPSQFRNEPDKRFLRMTQSDFKEALRAWGEAANNQYTEAYEYIGISIDDYNYMMSTDEDLYLTPRHALQQLGTEFGRACYKNIWVDYTLRQIAKKQESGLENFVISDVRFKSEAVSLQGVAKVVKIVRPNLTVKLTHASELEQSTMPASLIDYTIYNNETIDDFQKKIEHMLKTVKHF